MKGLFVGLTTVDALYLLDAFPAPNQKTVASRYGLFTGGPATNAAITFALLGGAATLVSAVGTGALGAVARRELADAGVTLADCAPSPEFAPALSSIFSVAATGTRNVVTAHPPALTASVFRGSDAVPIDFAELLQGMNVLLLDGHNLFFALLAARTAWERDIPVVLDGGSWKAGLEALLPLVDVAVCSEDFRLPEDASTTSAASAPSDAIRGLRERGVACCAVSRGEKPLLYVTDDGVSGEIAVSPSPIVDTLGAGDVLHGAFALHYARRRDFVFSLQSAAQVASFSCGFFGPREGVLRWRNSVSVENVVPRSNG